MIINHQKTKKHDENVFSSENVAESEKQSSSGMNGVESSLKDIMIENNDPSEEKSYSEHQISSEKVEKDSQESSEATDVANMREPSDTSIYNSDQESFKSMTDVEIQSSDISQHSPQQPSIDITCSSYFGENVHLSLEKVASIDQQQSSNNMEKLPSITKIQHQSSENAADEHEIFSSEGTTQNLYQQSANDGNEDSSSRFMYNDSLQSSEKVEKGDQTISLNNVDSSFQHSSYEYNEEESKQSSENNNDVGQQTPQDSLEVNHPSSEKAEDIKTQSSFSLNYKESDEISSSKSKETMNSITKHNFEEESSSLDSNKESSFIKNDHADSPRDVSSTKDDVETATIHGHHSTIYTSSNDIEGSHTLDEIHTTQQNTNDHSKSIANKEETESLKVDSSSISIRNYVTQMTKTTNFRKSDVTSANIDSYVNDHENGKLTTERALDVHSYNSIIKEKGETNNMSSEEYLSDFRIKSFESQKISLNDDSSGKLSKGAVAGIVVGVLILVALVVIIAILVVFYLKKNVSSRSSDLSSNDFDAETLENPNEVAMSTISGDSAVTDDLLTLGGLANADANDESEYEYQYEEIPTESKNELLQ